jgi:hypothetical protein
MFKQVVRLVLIASIGCASVAHAAVTYRISAELPTGDTIGIGGLADNGDLLMQGYGDLCTGGKSFILDRGGSANGGFVKGLTGADVNRNRECGAAVSAINSAGDMIGTSYNDALASISTFWRNGVAFDLTNPANAGLVFVADPGAVRLAAFDVSTLVIENPPAYFNNDYVIQLSRFRAFTNAKGELAFEAGFRRNGVLLTPVAAAVSAPATLALVGLGLLGVAISRRRTAAGLA